MVAASGRSQKRSGVLRPPPLSWFRIQYHIVKKLSWDKNFDNLLTIRSRPWTAFRGFSGGPPRWPILSILSMFFIIIRGLSGIHQNTILCQFSMDQGLYSVCRGQRIAVHTKRHSVDANNQWSHLGTTANQARTSPYRYKMADAQRFLHSHTIYKNDLRAGKLHKKVCVFSSQGNCTVRMFRRLKWDIPAIWVKHVFLGECTVVG